MKRTVWILLWLCLAVIPASAQQPKPSATITDKQWEDLVAATNNEDWNTTFNLSSKYLKQLKVDDETKELAYLRDIHIYAAAGKVIAGRMSYDELKREVKDFIGKEVIMPYRQIKLNCTNQNPLNFICPSEDANDKLTVSAANKSGTSIHFFARVQLQEKFDVERHNSRFAHFQSGS